MRFIHDFKGVSKLILILLLLVSFIVGALLSYIWTMGFYASPEFHLPSQANVSIEKVEFYVENATFFNVTLLNPSYSPAPVRIEQILISNGSLILKAPSTLPLLPHELTPGSSQTFKANLNWGNYTGQKLNIIVLLSDGSGATLKKTTPFMNFNITSVNLDPSLSVKYFNITVQNAGSSTFVNITRILVNGASVTVPTLTPLYGLANASDAPPVTFMLNRTWIDLQGEDVTVAIETMQGYTAYKTEKAPPHVDLSIDRLLTRFNKTDTRYYFNISVSSIWAEVLPTYVDISRVGVVVSVNDTSVEDVLLNSTEWNAYPSPRIMISSSIGLTRLICYWDWSRYQGQGAKATITVYTKQGFFVSAEASIP